MLSCVKFECWCVGHLGMLSAGCAGREFQKKKTRSVAQRLLLPMLRAGFGQLQVEHANADCLCA